LRLHGFSCFPVDDGSAGGGAICWRAGNSAGRLDFRHDAQSEAQADGQAPAKDKYAHQNGHEARNFGVQNRHEACGPYGRQEASEAPSAGEQDSAESANGEDKAGFCGLD